MTCHSKSTFRIITFLSRLSGVIVDRRARTPVGQEKRLAPSLPGSATEEGRIGRVTFFATEKALRPEAGRSAIYGNSEVFRANCKEA
jgi:hypothetical protein